MGHDVTIAYEPWPTFDEEKTVNQTVEMGVQVNGKLRAKISVSKDDSKEKIQELALSQANVQMHTANKNIVKIIVVPGKIVNIVVK